MGSSKPAVHFLRQQVETVLPEKPGYSRRFSNRFEMNERVFVYWSCAGTDDVSLIRNLSIGGLFITTPKSHYPGATAKVEFLVPDGQIRAEAVIRHVIPRQGLGLQFTALVKEDRSHFTALMGRLRSSSPESPDSSNSLLTKHNSALSDLTSFFQEVSRETAKKSVAGPLMATG